MESNETSLDRNNKDLEATKINTAICNKINSKTTITTTFQGTMTAGKDQPDLTYMQENKKANSLHIRKDNALEAVDTISTIQYGFKVKLKATKDPLTVFTKQIKHFLKFI